MKPPWSDVMWDELYFYFVILASGEGKILSMLWPREGCGSLSCLFDAVGDRDVKRTSRDLQRSLHSTPPFFFSCCFWWMITKQDLCWRIKNLPKYPAVAMLNNTVLLLCVHIMLFAGKLNRNSCVFPLKGREEKSKKPPKNTKTQKTHKKNKKTKKALTAY